MLSSTEMDQVTEYMTSNKLSLNQDKTAIMIVTKNKTLRKNFEITLKGKKVVHSNSVKILGSVLDQNLSWDKYVESELIPQLANRVKTLSLVGKYMDPKFRKDYCSAIEENYFLGWKIGEVPVLRTFQNYKDFKTRHPI